jgi:hypothetical protein
LALVSQPVSAALALTYVIGLVLVLSGFVRTLIGLSHWKEFGWIMLISGLFGIREVSHYAIAVVGLSAVVNFGLVTLLAGYDSTSSKVVAVAAAAVPAALVAWFVSTRILRIGGTG